MSDSTTTLPATLILGKSPASGTEPRCQVHFGDFVLLHELGRGGMGVVYKAHEPALNRIVALKMVLAGAFSDEADLQRFRTEASAAARLHHPHIVKVLRVGVHEEQHYFAMEFIEGPTLADRIKDGPLPGRMAARYLITIARAIQHAHEQGILHRDLKPGNILLDPTDQPHVADFGLAKHLSTDSCQTKTGALLGTPSYMSPEQAAGNKALTPATDVYGLGALLYELITARPPFRGETSFDTIMQVLENEPVPPRLLNPRVERDLETICLKCLAKNPRDRYPSAEAFALDLERYLAGDTIEARSMNMLDYLGRTLERSQFDLEFGKYGNVVLWFALIVGLMHVAKHIAIVLRWPAGVIVIIHVLQFTLMILVLLRYRAKGLLPTSTAERQLWAVWISYVLACSLFSVQMPILFGQESAYEGKLYPFFSILTGMAFFILGSSYWGMCYVVAFAFFALGLGLLADPRWGPLSFGGLWSLALVLIGLRLRRIGAERDQSE